MEQHPPSPEDPHEDSATLSFPWHAFPPQAQWVIAYGSAFFPQKSPPTPSASVSRANSHRPSSSFSDVDTESTWTASRSRSPFTGDGHRQPVSSPGVCTPRSSHPSSTSSFCLFSCCSPRAVGSAAVSSSSATNSLSPTSCRDYLVLVPAHSIEAFHQVNLRMHSDHYAWPFRLLGPSSASAFQRLGRGVEVFYNPLVRLHEGGEIVKYGVTSIEDFCRELQEWSSLFFSGRLHKPVRILSRDNKVPLTQAPFYDAIRLNRLNALRAGVLLQEKPLFSLRQLLYAICGLSYTGDIRMAFVENPRKLTNLVWGQTMDLFSIYAPLLPHIPELRLIHTSSADFTAKKEPLQSSPASCPSARRDAAGSCTPLSPTDCAPSSLASKELGLHAAETHSPMPAKIGSSQGGILREKMRVAGPSWREDILSDRVLVEVQGCQQNDPDRWAAFRRSLCDELPPKIRQMARQRSRSRGCDGSPAAADVSAALVAVVRRSSTVSACKNMATAGLLRTVSYGLQKLSKR